MSVTVNSIYLTTCARINETFGLQLGLVTQTQFLQYIADVVIEFLRDTRISKTFVTQPIEYATSLYSNPDLLADIEALFVQGRFKPRTNLESLDNSRFRWRVRIGPVDVWYEDGLPINTVGLVDQPNWSGVQYPAQASGAPGYQYIDGSQLGVFVGTVNTNGTNLVTQASGSLFQYPDTTWFGKTITIGGVPFTITGLVDNQHLEVNAAIGAAAGVAYSVTYPISIPASDRNLTVYGAQIPDPEPYILDTPIPYMPDSATLYLGYGVLAKIFGDDSELRDRQKALFCSSRFNEGVSLFRAILEQELLDSDDE